jgi:hypothetical protein
MKPSLKIRKRKQDEDSKRAIIKSNQDASVQELSQGSRKTCHGFVAGVRPNLTAIFTMSARESAFIFSITLPRCAFTVISLIPSFNPTCL